MNWGHASAQQLRRVLADSDAGNMRLADGVAAVLEQRGVHRSFDTAPHLPFAGRPTFYMFNEKLQVYLLFWAVCFVRTDPKKCGAPPAVRGSGFLDNQGVSR